MGKRRGKRAGRKVQAAKQTAKRVEQSAAAGVTNYAVGGSGFDAARRSERRGSIYFPQIDTSREISRGTRLEILRKARWGDANVGLVRRAVGGLANLVGYQMPQAASGDEAWDALAEAAVLRRWNNPDTFDVAGKMDAWSWQLALTRCRFRDGDNLTALGRSQSGGALVTFYESHQVDSGDKEKRNLVDGVFLGVAGRHLKYNICGQRWDGALVETEITARDSIYHADFERPGRVREVSMMAHAINNVVDIVEILADTKHAVKMSALMGFVMTTANGSGGTKMGSELAAFLRSQDAGATESGDDGVDVEINIDQIMQGGRAQALPEGADMKVLSDQRPHPNQLNLLRWLVRDIAWGAGVAPEVLWEASGLGGTAQRYVMAETRRWVQHQQRVQRQACQRMWTYTLALEIKAGRVPEPPAGVSQWWKAEWIPQADLTIDRGRDGNLELAQIAKGLKTYKQAYAERQLDYKKQFEQVAKERAEMESLGLVAEDLI